VTVPFRLLSSVADLTAGSHELISRVVTESGFAHDGVADLEPRLSKAATWMTEYVAEADRTTVRTTPSSRLSSLTEDEAAWLQTLLAELPAAFELEPVTSLIYGVPKLTRGLSLDDAPTDEVKADQKTFFKLLYNLLVDADRGPRLPTLFLALGPDTVRMLLTPACDLSGRQLLPGPGTSFTLIHNSLGCPMNCREILPADESRGKRVVQTILDVRARRASARDGRHRPLRTCGGGVGQMLEQRHDHHLLQPPVHQAVDVPDALHRRRPESDRPARQAHLQRQPDGRLLGNGLDHGQRRRQGLGHRAHGRVGVGVDHGERVGDAWHHGREDRAGPHGPLL